MSQTFRKITVILSGVFFSIYSVYNVFIIFRDRKELSVEGIVISAIVVFAFAALAMFSFTAITGSDDLKFLMIRSTAFIIGLLIILVLKFRMSGSVIDFLDISSPPTVLYFASYALVQAALFLLLFYYTFIVRRLPLFPRASVIFPLIVMVLFTLSLIIEEIIIFAYGIIIEANFIRTIVMRPVFYLGFICLCAYFIFHPKIIE